MSMEQSGREVAAKRAKASDDDAGGEDRLSALPDDILVVILLCLYTQDAARTSVLSRRWRHVWTFLPELRFYFVRDSHCLHGVLSANEVPLRYLFVGDQNASPESLAAWLPTAARRVSGELVLYVSERGAADGEAEEAKVSPRANFELPCFEKATSIYLNLGFLALSVPPAVVFARLNELFLTEIRFHSPGDLWDAVSSPRCPCLQKLTIHNVRGVESITINSVSLQLLDLKNVRGVRQLTVVAPALTDLALLHCFTLEQNQPIVNLSVPQLKSLKWVDAYDPSSVHLGSMEHLQTLSTFFFVYGLDGFQHNHPCPALLPLFKAIENFVLSLAYLTEVENLQYMMEYMTMLPDATSLHLILIAQGHAFGACLFHVLRICSGIKQLMLTLSIPFDLKELSACSSGCICDQPTNWKTEEISLNHLHELGIDGFRASEHEVAFVKRLLNWVPVLKTMTVTFHHSITKSKAKELFQMFQGFSRPGVCMQFYTYQRFRKVLFAPED